MLPTVGKLIEPGSSGVLFWQRYPTEFVLMNWRGFVTEMCPATPSRERTSCSRSCLSCVLLSSHSDCLTTKLPNHCAFSGRLHLLGRYQGYLSRRQMAAAYRAMALRNVLCYVIASSAANVVPVVILTVILLCVMTRRRFLLYLDVSTNWLMQFEWSHPLFNAHGSR